MAAGTAPILEPLVLTLITYSTLLDGEGSIPEAEQGDKQ